MRLRLFVLPALVICASCAIARWRDTDECRGEIRRGAEKVLKQLSEKQS